MPQLNILKKEKIRDDKVFEEVNKIANLILKYLNQRNVTRTLKRLNVPRASSYRI